jgi:hypothetical protein
MPRSRPTGPPRRPRPRARGRSGPAAAKASPVVKIVVWAHGRDLDPAHGRSAGHVVPAYRDAVQRLVERAVQPDPVDHPELPGCADNGFQPDGCLVPQLSGGDDPGDDHPDPHRGVRGLRVHLHGVQGEELLLHPHRRPARHPQPVAFVPLFRSSSGCSASTAPSWRCGWSTSASVCRWPSTSCATTWAPLPKAVIESAKIDGASHFTTFWRLIIPMSYPALASFAIFQFLWVWNDLFVALIFLQGEPVMTVALKALMGQHGSGPRCSPAARSSPCCSRWSSSSRCSGTSSAV